MTRPSADIVKMTWDGFGGGTVTLGSAVTGFSAFPSSLNGMTVSYSIEHQTSSEREAGVGVYTHSGTTLTRVRVTASSNGGSHVSFSNGTKHVRIVALAEDLYENRAATNPTVNDDLDLGYTAGRSFWFNTATTQWWLCKNHANGAAVWDQIVTASEIGTIALADNAATNAKLADMAAWTVKVRNAATSGDPSDANLAAITEEPSPASGDFMLGFVDTGEIRKFNISNLGSVGLPVSDTTALVKGTTTATKLWRVEVDGFTAATTRVLTPADRNWSPTVFGEELTEVADAPGAVIKLNLGNLANLDQVSSPTDFAATGTADSTTALLGNNTWSKIGQAQLNATGSGVDGRVLTDTGAGMAWEAPTGGAGGLALTNDANTAITIGDAVTGTHRRLTSDSAITLTLDAQTTVGTRVGVTKAGSGVVTVAMEAGAGYFVPGDDQGDTAATAGFTVSGYAEFLCVLNSGGSAAKFVVFGQTSLVQEVDADVDFTGGAVYGNLISVVSSVSGTLTIPLHLGRLIRTGGNITVPTTPGFHCMVIFGGTHTVTFNGTVSPAGTIGQVSSIVVETASVIKMSTPANPVVFT